MIIGRTGSLPKSFRIMVFAAVIVVGTIGAPQAAAQESSEPATGRNVKEFGAVCNGVHDDTHSILDALTAARNDATTHPTIKVIIPDNCVSGPLVFGSEQWVEFEEGATLHALRGAFPAKTTPFVAISGQHDVTIKGHRATIAMNRDEYTDGEWRAGVLIYKSKNVWIDNLKVNGAGGDGFTIVGTPQTPENVSLVDVAANECTRNGISIISGRNVTVTRATLTNTYPNGRGSGNNGPWAGLDVEPNGEPGEALDNIKLEDIHTSGNGGAGLQFTLHDMRSTTITVSNFHSDHDGGHNHGIGLYYGGILFATGGLNPKSPVDGQILIEGATIVASGGSGVLWREWSANQPKTILRNVTIDSPGAQTGNMNRCGLYYNVKDNTFGNKYGVGAHLNVEVDGLVVKDGNKRLIRAVWFEGDAARPLQVTVKNVREGNGAPRVQVKER
jgi:hypothetical protein